MAILQVAFILLHVITAAAWFGLGLRIVAPARLIAGLDPEAARSVAADGFRSARLMTLFIVQTFFFALGAFFTGGGFSAYGPAYHTSMLLIVGLILVQVLLIQSGWRSVALHAGTDTAGVEMGRKRIAMGMGIGHLLWLVILILMFANNFQAAFHVSRIPA